MSFQPTVAEERLMAAGAPTQWKSFSMFPRIGFFILSTICALALFGFFEVAGSRRVGVFIAGAITLGVAELLIQQFHFFAAGLEEALWFAGILEIAGCFVPSNAQFETWFTVFGLASLVAAVRLLNPFCAVLGAALVPFVAYHVADVVCAVIAVGALALLPLPRRRPSVEHTLAALAVVMPLVAYFYARDGKFNEFDPRLAAALLLYAVAALIVGLRFRLHAPLLALFPTLGCLAYEARDLTGMSLEARLIVWGSIVLAVSIAVDRVLRTPRSGITSRQLKDDRLFDLLQLAGTVAIAPHERPAEQPSSGPQIETGKGSSFGGAGAGGDF